MNLLRTIDSMAVKYRWIAHVVLWFGVASFAWMAADRDPPFAVLSVVPAAARPGDFITITASVRRDTDRQCSALMSRYVFDAARTRYILDHSYVTSDTINEMDALSPGLLRVTFQLPPSITPGAAALVSDIEYECNRTHRIWPITVRTVIPFEVLPP